MRGGVLHGLMVVNAALRLGHGSSPCTTRRNRFGRSLAYGVAGDPHGHTLEARLWGVGGKWAMSGVAAA